MLVAMWKSEEKKEGIQRQAGVEAWGEMRHGGRNREEGSDFRASKIGLFEE